MCMYFSEQQKRKDLDIVTGFQLLDGKNHVFVLEGLQDGGIQKIWDSISKPKEGLIYRVTEYFLRID